MLLVLSSFPLAFAQIECTPENILVAATADKPVDMDPAQPIPPTGPELLCVYPPTPQLHPAGKPFH